jgi:hypothetical protein
VVGWADEGASGSDPFFFLVPETFDSLVYWTIPNQPYKQSYP